MAEPQADGDIRIRCNDATAVTTTSSNDSNGPLEARVQRCFDYLEAVCHRMDALEDNSRSTLDKFGARLEYLESHPKLQRRVVQ